MIRLSNNQRERLARESQDERDARLDRMRANQRERLARESQDERDARLDRTSANQRERLARESQDECDARLDRTSAYLAMLTYYINTNCECLYCCVGIQLLLEISNKFTILHHHTKSTHYIGTYAQSYEFSNFV